MVIEKVQQWVLKIYTPPNKFLPTLLGNNVLQNEHRVLGSAITKYDSLIIRIRVPNNNLWNNITVIRGITCTCYDVYKHRGSLSK